MGGLSVRFMFADKEQLLLNGGIFIIKLCGGVCSRAAPK